MAKTRRLRDNFLNRVRDNVSGGTRLVSDEEMPAFMADQQAGMQRYQQAQQGLMDAWGQGASIQQALLKQKAAQEAAARDEQLKRDQMAMDARDRNVKNRLSANQQRIQEENYLRGDALQRAGMQDAMTRFAQDMGFKERAQEQNVANAQEQLRLQRQAQDNAMFNAEAGRQLTREQMEQSATQFADRMGLDYQKLDLDQQQFLLNLAQQSSQFDTTNQRAYDQMRQDQGQFDASLDQRAGQFLAGMDLDWARFNQDARYRADALSQARDLAMMKDAEDRRQFDTRFQQTEDIRQDGLRQQQFQNDQAIQPMLARLRDVPTNEQGQIEKDRIIRGFRSFFKERDNMPRDVAASVLSQLMNRAEVFAADETLRRPDPTLAERAGTGTFVDAQGNLVVDADANLNVYPARGQSATAQGIQLPKGRRTTQDYLKVISQDDDSRKVILENVDAIIENQTPEGSTPDKSPANILKTLKTYLGEQAAIHNGVLEELGVIPRSQGGQAPVEQSSVEDGETLLPKQSVDPTVKRFQDMGMSSTTSPHHVSNRTKYQPDIVQVPEEDLAVYMQKASQSLAPSTNQKGLSKSPGNKHFAKLKKQGMSDEDAAATMNRNFANPAIVQSMMAIGIKDPVKNMMKGADKSAGKKAQSQHFSSLSDEAQQIVLNNSAGPLGPFVMTNKELEQRLEDGDFDNVPAVFFDEDGNVHALVEELNRASARRKFKAKKVTDIEMNLPTF